MAQEMTTFCIFFAAFSTVAVPAESWKHLDLSINGTFPPLITGLNFLNISLNNFTGLVAPANCFTRAQLKEKVIETNLMAGGSDRTTVFQFPADNGHYQRPLSPLNVTSKIETRGYISPWQKAIIILYAISRTNILKARGIIYFISFFVLVTGVSASKNEGDYSPSNNNEDNKLFWKIGIICLVLVGVALFLISLGLRYAWLAYLRGEPRRVIERLPSLAFVCAEGSGVGAFGTTRCGICQMELVEGDCLRILPCAHIFHTECLVAMVTIGTSVACPECRRTFGVIIPPAPDPEPHWAWLGPLA